MAYSVGAMERVLDVDAHDGGRDYAEVGQRRIAPADVRHARKDIAELVLLRQLLQQRARVGDRDEVFAGSVALDLPHALKEVPAEDPRLGGSGGLARDDAQR